MPLEGRMDLAKDKPFKLQVMAAMGQQDCGQCGYLCKSYAEAIVIGKESDLTSPFVLKKGSTVEDFAAKVHKDFAEKLKLAKVWGQGVFDGQMVQRDYALHDGDVVELHI